MVLLFTPSPSTVRSMFPLALSPSHTLPHDPPHQPIHLSFIFFCTLHTAPTGLPLVSCLFQPLSSPHLELCRCTYWMRGRSSFAITRPPYLAIDIVTDSPRMSFSFDSVGSSTVQTIHVFTIYIYIKHKLLL